MDATDPDDELRWSVLEAIAAAEPDALALVCEVADVMSSLAADRFIRVADLHREARAEAARLGNDLTDVVERGIRLELAAALRITEHAADRLITLAESLVGRYPVVLGALSGARITERHCEVLVDTLNEQDDSIRGTLLPRALELAELQPVGAFRRALRALVDEVCVQALAERHEEALRHRRIAIEPAGDGMAWLMALMPAVEARAVHTRVTLMAKALIEQEGDERTLDQARADVVGDLLVDGAVVAHPAAARGIRASVVVTVPALTLLSGDGESARVEGIGPVSVEVARELCGGAHDWMRVLTHPETGMVLSVGRDRYRPPAALRALARWRADRCMAPGCGVPASRCETDHTLAWEHGGETSVANLAPLCKGHHLVKHHGGWSVTAVDGGALGWISPAGRRYVSQPERRLPVFTIPPGAPPDHDQTPPF